MPTTASLTEGFEYANEPKSASLTEGFEYANEPKSASLIKGWIYGVSDFLLSGFEYVWHNLLLDGFDYYAADRLPLKWQTATNLTITQHGKGGGGCLEPLAGAYTLQSISLNDAAAATLGFAYRISAYKGMTIGIGGATIVINDGVISISADGGSTFEASSAATLPIGRWKYIEMTVTDDTATVYVNDSAWVTAAIATTGIPDITIANLDSDTAVGSWRMDHLYITFGTGAFRFGPSKITVVEAVADATPQNWTPSDTPAWAQVSDWPGDISTDATGHESRFTLGTLPAGMMAGQANAYGTSTIEVSVAVDADYSNAVVLGEDESLLRHAGFWTTASEISVSS